MSTVSQRLITDCLQDCSSLARFGLSRWFVLGVFLINRDHVQGKAIVLAAQMASKYDNQRGTIHMDHPPIHQEETLLTR